MKPRENPAGMGRVVTAARVLQMLPVPSPAARGVLRTHLGEGEKQRGEGRAQRPWSLGTDASLGRQLGRRVCLPPREADDGCSGAPPVGSML